MRKKENLLGMIGLCNRSGKIIIGSERIAQAAQRGQVKLLVCAQDTGVNTQKTVEKIAKNHHIPLLVLFSKEELGPMAGKQEASVVAVCDKGFAASILKKSEELRGGDMHGSI